MGSHCTFCYFTLLQISLKRQHKYGLKGLSRCLVTSANATAAASTSRQTSQHHKAKGEGVHLRLSHAPKHLQSQVCSGSDLGGDSFECEPAARTNAGCDREEVEEAEQTPFQEGPVRSEAATSTSDGTFSSF